MCIDWKLKLIPVGYLLVGTNKMSLYPTMLPGKWHIVKIQFLHNMSDINEYTSCEDRDDNTRLSCIPVDWQSLPPGLIQIRPGNVCVSRAPAVFGWSMIALNERAQQVSKILGKCFRAYLILNCQLLQFHCFLQSLTSNSYTAVEGNDAGRQWKAMM